MSAGQGFEFTPLGIVPIGSAVNVGDQVSGGVVPRTTAVQIDSEPPSPALPSRALSSLATPRLTGLQDNVASKPLDGKRISALIKARLKELDKLLAAVPALERERSSLKALLAAAAPSKRRKGIQ